MFTGLIEDIGTIDAIQLANGGARLTVRSTLATGELAAVPLGASIAVQGACLTVTEHRRGTFVFDVSRETLSRTMFGTSQVGQRVHLERAMQLGARLDGHLVQGHIDGLGHALGSERSGDGWTCNYRVPTELLPYVVLKGSIAIDGVSLTIAELEGDGVAVAVVPHTASNTLLVHHRPGQRVHLETDIIGKYVARLMGFSAPQGPGHRPSGIDAAFLATHGFDRGAHR
jgi:riboflavin synthase